ELRLLDEDGMPTLTGESGNLWVKGDSAAPFYWRQHEKSLRTMVGEWTSTGDLYKVGGDGFYWYQGRAGGMIKSGGEWVSPARIENVLLQHPSVRDAAVVGENIEGLTRIRAVVVPRNGVHPSEQELQQWCKERLCAYEYPHRVGFSAELPKT